MFKNPFFLNKGPFKFNFIASKVNLPNNELFSQDTNNIFDKSSLLDRDDLRIKMMLKRHINYTNSKKAKNILEDFNSNLKNFYKVFPLDFRKALEQSIKSKNKKSKKVL